MGKKQRRKKRALVQASFERYPFLFKLIGWLAVLSLAVPLLKRPHAYLASYYTQFTVMQILIEVMFACWLILAIKDRRFRPDWRSPALWGLLAFIGTMLLALPFAVDPAYSFWSRPTRMTGVINYLHYGAWLFVLLATFKKPEQYRKLLIATSIVSIVIGLIGFADWWVNPGSTVQSYLGNPSFFGVYMLLHALIGVYLLAGTKTVKSRILPVVTIVVAVVSVFLSGSRGAVLTLFASVVIGAIIYFLYSKTYRPVKISVIVALLVLAISAVAGFALLRSDSMRGWVDEHLSGPTHRLITRDFGSDRWVLWNYGWRGVLERPLFGWGMEQYEVSFYKHYDPLTEDVEIMNEQYADRAHNQYLDVLIASGFFGLVGYLAFLLLLLHSAWTAVRKSENSIALLKNSALSAAVLAYCGYGLIMFDTPMAVMVSFLAYGVIAANYRKVCGPAEPEAELIISNNSLALAAPILVMMFVVVLLVNVMPAVKIWQTEEAVKLTDTNRTAALEQYKIATTGYNPYALDLRLRLLTKIKKWSENVSLQSSQLQKLVEYTVPLMEDAATKRSYNMRFQLAAAAMFRIFGDYNPAAYAIAEEYAQTVIQTAPGRPEAYIEQGEIDITQNDADSAILYLMKAIERVPIKNRHVSRYIYFRLASAYALKCDHQESKKNFDIAAEYGHPHHKDTRFLLDLDRGCRSDRDFSWVADHVDQLLVVYPDHPRVLPAAARIYMLSEQPDKAVEMVERLDKRDPGSARQLAEELELINEEE